VLLDLLHHAIEVGIASTEHPCKLVPSAFGNLLAVYDHVELAGLAGDEDGFQAQPLLNSSRETRGFYLIAVSRRAVEDLDFHSVHQSILRTSSSS
jgi:hypothetical protein